MVHRSQNSSPRSRSPPSANISPASHTSSLAPSMAHEESDASSRSNRTTPNRQPVELPRTQVASKGGCWTCRLRRKKCDEQREGDSCKTCIRLTIDCLGWGPKRPDWMRDKQQVEAYKAEIKARLTRAGLIRGQPRPPPSSNAAPPVSSQPRTQPPPYPRTETKQTSSLGLEPEFTFPFVDGQQGPVVVTGMPGLPHSMNQLPVYPDGSVNTLDLTFPSWFSYPHSPQPITPLPLATQLPSETMYEFPSLDPLDPSVTVQPPSPEPFPQNPITENEIQSGHVLYYFEHVRKMHYVFAGNNFTNMTYTLIVQEPRGAVSNAVCALASLHFTNLRIAQGLEVPDPRSEYSNATYFHNEAIKQLTAAKQMQGGYSESDAFAALHLVSYSQLSGCKEDWQRAYDFACDWLNQTHLVDEEHPRPLYDALSTIGHQIYQWLDVVSSVTLTRPPRYLKLCRKLLGERQNGRWAPSSGLRMDTLIGCPDEAMLCMAEAAALFHWKNIEKRKGTLSYRELIRRGDEIEQKMRQHRLEPFNEEEHDSAPHPNLPMSSSSELGPGSFLGDETRKMVGNIFRENAALYLHTVLSDCNPGVPEISASVNTVVQLLQQLPPSEADRGLVLPLCLAGCMSDDAIIRTFVKQRMGMREESVGNFLHCRLLVESVWQKRDREGGPVDFRNTLRESSLNLLLI